MKVFISWSGTRSKALAIALKEWLPLILQYTKPWVSDKDISAGDRWAQAIAGELESSNFGILCITPENINSEWILFEAGALSKSMLDAKVIPILFGLELSDLSGPLSQFQALKVDQQGMLDVAKSINKVAEQQAEDAHIEELVPALWEKLRQKLDDIPNKEDDEKHARPQTEILEELVFQVRGLGVQLRDFDHENMEPNVHQSSMRDERANSLRLASMMRTLKKSSYGNLSLLILTGFVRGRMPWLAEVMVEAHRDLKTATPEQAREILEGLSFVLDGSTHSHLGEQLTDGSRFTASLITELRFLIDRLFAEQTDIPDFEGLVDPDTGAFANS
ncbi:MAG: toll/interleukin-1 receptor domain-containing protein [Sedimentitalea sp.]|uniref:toll/interleukin-1 receptor domain-containing protein n=1 Tax=Sedimentitalea sp. TaxID=2048915 RepID=UPI003299DC23